MPNEAEREAAEVAVVSGCVLNLTLVWEVVLLTQTTFSHSCHLHF